MYTIYTGSDLQGEEGKFTWSVGIECTIISHASPSSAKSLPSFLTHRFNQQIARRAYVYYRTTYTVLYIGQYCYISLQPNHAIDLLVPRVIVSNSKVLVRVLVTVYVVEQGVYTLVVLLPVETTAFIIRRRSNRLTRMLSLRGYDA